MKYHFTFACWETGYLRPDAPPQDILDTLPAPIKSRGYHPAWGKYSESARKATYTRDHKRHLQNRELFAREVLPVVLPLLNHDSLHDIGVFLRRADLIEKGGKRLWVAGNRSQWIATGHPDEARAAAIGAAPLTAPDALEYLKPKTP
jgi:hypothetical protein